MACRAEARADGRLGPPTRSFGAAASLLLRRERRLVGCLGFAPSSRRLRAGTSPSKFATLVAVCNDRDAKAEWSSQVLLDAPKSCSLSRAAVNHRGQICEVLIDTGISRRGKRNPKRTESGVRPLLRPCGVSADAPDSLGKWTGMRVARPLLRFGRC